MQADFEQFAQRLRSVTDIDALQAVCLRFVRSQGATMASYHHLPPPGARDYDPSITVAAFGFPDPWVALYTSEKLYEIDPIPKHALNATTPFWWSDARSLPHLSPDERRYLALLREADFGDGLAAPVFGPHGRNGYVGLGFGKQPPRLDDADISRLHWACQLGHLRYCELLRLQHPEAVQLSKRETEILEWVARGKSNSVIGEILGISAHTVDTHLRRAFVKLDVSDRVTAALRGLANGLIT